MNHWNRPNDQQGSVTATSSFSSIELSWRKGLALGSLTIIMGEALNYVVSKTHWLVSAFVALLAYGANYHMLERMLGHDVATKSVVINLIGLVVAPISSSASACLIRKLSDFLRCRYSPSGSLSQSKRPSSSLSLRVIMLALVPLLLILPWVPFVVLNAKLDEWIQHLDSMPYFGTCFTGVSTSVIIFAVARAIPRNILHEEQQDCEAPSRKASPSVSRRKDHFVTAS